MNHALSRTMTFVLLAALAACGGNEAPAPRGIPEADRREPVVRAPEPQAEAQPPAPEPRAPSKLKSPFELGPGDLTAEQPAQAAPAGQKPEEKQRDLGQELADAASRTGCFDVPAAAKQPGGRLVVSASAYVMPSGRITRATVSAPGQPSSALRCAEQKLVQMGIPGPLEEAESIQGQTTLEVMAAANQPPAQAAAPAPPATAVYPSAPPAPYVEGAEPPPSQRDMAQPTSDYSVTGTARPDEQAGAP
jgi:hypothetical protein